MDEFIERRIITSLIISDEYIREISKVWETQFLQSATAKLLAGWVFDYYAKYGKAPKKDIEGIYTSHLKELDKTRAEDIEEILSGLSHEYEREQLNVRYSLDQTYQYFQEQHLKQFADEVKGQLVAGQIIEAEKIATGYRTIETGQINYIDPFASASKIKDAFAERQKPLIRFGGALGKFWGEQMVRDSFVALLGREKIGKTWMLLEMAMKANASGCNVAFFQAGDMTENQFLLRMCVYMAKRSYKEKYCSNIFIPTIDCVKNQFNTCNKEERECDFGVFDEGEKKEQSFDSLKNALLRNPDYKPCRNCKEIEPTVWLKEQPPTKPLTYKEAYRAIKKWRERHKKRFHLSTYANETLSILEIKSLLDIWERQEGFVPDVIIIDYADLLASDPDVVRLDFRNRQNVIWQRLRALSQERHCLVITATQAATTAYGKKLMSMSDFSEDKRKMAHVTALFGLNQTAEEKEIGIMRINPIVVREDDYAINKPVHVLQRLQIGRPVLGSFFYDSPK